MEEHTLQQQFDGLQQMFGWVLRMVDRPVKVYKDDLKQPLGGLYMIAIDETEDAFIFSLEPVPAVPADE